MMNKLGTLGESSSKRQENGDVSTGSERPLKKARFAWQVKGKYHLKGDVSESRGISPPKEDDCDKSVSSDEIEHVTKDSADEIDEKLDVIGNYVVKKDFNNLDSVIDESENSLLKPISKVSTESIEYPRYISSFERCNTDKHRITNPTTMTEDKCIAQWQARQLAKGFMDNSINRMLESAERDNNRFFALDIASFSNNLPGDNSVENEGILMAISAHGLQNASSSTSDSDNVDKSSSSKEEFLSPPTSPASEQETSTLLDFKWVYADDLKSNITSEITPLTFFPESSKSYEYYNNDRNETVDDNDDKSEIIDYDNEHDDNNLISHYDFLDAAVSFAIQNIGLTSFGAEYG